MKLMIMNKKTGIDTNILIYAIDTSFPLKKKISENLIDSLPVINTQCISEFANICIRKFNFDKVTTLQIINRILKKCVIQNCSASTYLLAEKIMKHYQFQLFDSIIIASSLESGCETFFTEDLHHGLLIEKQLRICNPFK